MYMAVWRTCTDTVTGLFLFCGVCFIVFISLIFVVLFVCLFPFCSHVSLLAFRLPVFNKLQLSWRHRTVSNKHWRCSCFNEWASCCRWQHLWGTALGGEGFSKDYNISTTHTRQISNMNKWSRVMWHALTAETVSEILQITVTVYHDHWPNFIQSLIHQW